VAEFDYANAQYSYPSKEAALAATKELTDKYGVPYSLEPVDGGFLVRRSSQQDTVTRLKPDAGPDSAVTTLPNDGNTGAVAQPVTNTQAPMLGFQDEREPPAIFPQPVATSPQVVTVAPDSQPAAPPQGRTTGSLYADGPADEIDVQGGYTPGAGLNELMGRQPAVPQGPVTLTNKQTSTTVQSPDFNPKLLPEAQRQADARSQNSQEIFQAQESNIASRSDALYQYQQEAETYRDQKSAEAKQYGAKVDKTLQILEKTKEDIANTQIDPDRYLNRMSKTQSVLTNIGVAFSSFGATMAKSPNFVMQLIDKAIDRDIAVQEFEYRKKLQTSQLTKEQLDIYMSLHRNAEIAARDASLTAAKWRLSQLDLNDMSTKNKQTLYDTIAEIDSKQLALRNAARAKTSTTTTITQHDILPKQSDNAGKAPAYNERKDLQEQLSSLRSIDKLTSMHDKGGKIGVWGYGNEAYRIYEAQKNLAAAAYAKAMSGAAMTEKEYQRYYGSFAGGWAPVKEPGDTGAQKNRMFKDQVLERVYQTVKSNPQLMKTLSPSELRSLDEYAQRRSRGTVASNTYGGTPQ
jgi:hypothetical protein